jgi:8-oxo-dGTP pyrophosphatase MutT (NUDIX family)
LINKTIPSSTVLIIRDGVSGLEVFMVVRHHQIDFAAGALVFPGGKVDKSDYNKKLNQHLCEEETSDRENIPFKIAAVRECFEEANVLFAKNNHGREIINADELFKLKKWRDAFINASTSMYEFARLENLLFSIDALIPFSHWVTPEKMQKRFDTRFYIAVAPKGHEGQHDGNESVDSIWINPQQALDDCLSEKRNIIFPTRLNLEKLNQSKTVAEAINNAKNSNIVTVTPLIEKLDEGIFITIPKEAGYGEIKEVINHQRASIEQKVTQ